jgi:hypothetical protein
MPASPKFDAKRLAYAIGWLIAFRAAGNALLGLLAPVTMLRPILPELASMMTLSALLAFWICHQRGVLPGLQENPNAAGMAEWVAQTTQYRTMLARLETPIEQPSFGKASALPPEGRAVPELSFTRTGNAPTTEQRAAERIRSLRKPR